MKRSLLFILLTVLAFSSQAQDWRDADGKETVESVRQKFKTYYDQRRIAQAREQRKAIRSGRASSPNAELEEKDLPGFKQFKRWEYFWERRTMPDGSMPAPDQVYNEYKQQQRASAGASQGNWTFMGPSNVPSNGGGAGRVNCVAIDPTNQSKLWVGSPAGGLWKSVDGGTTWTSNTDLLPNLGVSDIVINPQNPSIMYIATGDGDGGDTYSLGVMKSTDGGVTWNQTGLNYVLTNSKYINRLVMDPTNPNVLLAACNNGIYRTDDAGATWSQRRIGNFKEIKFNPLNGNVAYASSGSNIVKSKNNGVTWALSNSGLPTSGMGRTALAVTPADTSVVYVLFTKPSPDYGFHSVYKTTNSATSWVKMSDAAGGAPNLLGWDVNGGDAGGQAWYDLGFACSETNSNVILVGGVNLWKSSDGGVSWGISSHWYGANGKPYVHADCHMIKFAPGSGSTLYACVDGGIFKSTNGGTNWSDKSNGLQIMQFYKIGSSKTNPARVLGGSQDNGTNMINNASWRRVVGGDGMECLVDNTNDQVMFGELYYGDIRKSVDGGFSFYSVSPNSNDGAWVTPYIMDPNNNDIMYIGYDEIFKSTDNGENWTQITTNLTGGSKYETMAIAPSNSNYVFAGTAGNIYRSTNGGASWASIMSNLPLGSLRITYITVSPSEENTIYVTLSGYTAGEKIYRTTNGGQSWDNISSNLPNIPTNCVEVENNVVHGTYVGTDLGVYYKNDTMTSWVPYNGGLPNVIVNELEINYLSGKIRAGTYGRGLWEASLYTITGIQNAPTLASLKIYPNPSTGLLTISGLRTDTETKVVIYNNQGQVVFKQSLRDEAVYKADLTDFASGVYHLSLEADEDKRVEKIVLLK